MDLLPIRIERAEFDPFSSIDGYPSTVSASLTDDGSEQEHAAKPNLSTYVIHGSAPLSSLQQPEDTSTKHEESRSGGQIYVEAGAPSLEKGCNHLEEIFVMNYRRWEVWLVVDRQSRRGHLAVLEYDLVSLSGKSGQLSSLGVLPKQKRNWEEFTYL